MLSIPQSHDLPRAELPLVAAAELQDSLMTSTNDLDRLQRLLNDAADTLMGHFHGASCALHEALAAADQRVEQPMLQQALQHIGGAVIALQFQDLASQLIHHTGRRLRHCADQLARDVMGDDEEGTTVIEDVPYRPNPVTQDEMDAGSIELF